MTKQLIVRLTSDHDFTASTGEAYHIPAGTCGHVTDEIETKFRVSFRGQGMTVTKRSLDPRAPTPADRLILVEKFIDKYLVEMTNL